MQLIAILMAIMALLVVNVVGAPAAVAEGETNMCLPHWLFGYEDECELNTVDGYIMCLGACLEQPGPRCGDCMGAICAPLYDGGPSCCQCTC